MNEKVEFLSILCTHVKSRPEILPEALNITVVLMIITLIERCESKICKSSFLFKQNLVNYQETNTVSRKNGPYSLYIIAIFGKGRPNHREGVDLGCHASMASVN